MAASAAKNGTYWPFTGIHAEKLNKIQAERFIRGKVQEPSGRHETGVGNAGASILYK